MVQNEIQERIDELKRQIDSLQSGTVSTKKSREKSIIITASALTAKRSIKRKQRSKTNNKKIKII